MTNERKGVSKMPSREEVLQFMQKEALPYRFRLVKAPQPLRVNIEQKVIYVGEDVLMSVIKNLVEDGLDWREIMRKNLMHEKTHEKYQKWLYKWGVSAEAYGWLPSFLIDVVIDKIHFKDNKRYQKWLLADARHAYKITKRDLPTLIPPGGKKPSFLYVQAAYWVSIGAITLDEAIELYPEKADFIIELAQIFNRINREEDLEWAFNEAREIYLRKIGPY